MMRGAAVVVLAAAMATTAQAGERGYELRHADAKRPAPLVVILHCYGCPPSYLPQQLGVDAAAKRYGFVVAVPAGLSDSRGQPFWNATPACCDFDGKKPDDAGYVMRVIDELVQRGTADPKRVYLVGFSNGGFLAYRLACEQAAKIAAIVSIGGAAPETCNPSAPVSVLEVHGQRDEIVPPDGGKLGGGFPQRAAFPSARATVASWARIDGCVAAGAERWRCRHGSVERWTLPGGHAPDLTGEQLDGMWRWLAAKHK